MVYDSPIHAMVFKISLLTAAQYKSISPGYSEQAFEPFKLAQLMQKKLLKVCTFNHMILYESLGSS